MTAGGIPSKAFGVVVKARSSWRPFLLGVIGAGDWQASASATALTPGRSLGGGSHPARASRTPATTASSTVLRSPTSTPASARTSRRGHLNIPGGFGWLKFGLGTATSATGGRAWA